MIRWDGLLKLMVPPWVQIQADLRFLKMGRFIEIDGASQSAFMTLNFLLEFAGARPQTHESLLKKCFFTRLIPFRLSTTEYWFDPNSKKMIWCIEIPLAPKNLEQLKILSGKGNVETTVCLFLIRLFVLFLLHEQCKLPVHLCRPRWPQQSDWG